MMLQTWRVQNGPVSNFQAVLLSDDSMDAMVLR